MLDISWNGQPRRPPPFFTQSSSGAKFGINCKSKVHFRTNRSYGNSSPPGGAGSLQNVFMCYKCNLFSVDHNTLMHPNNPCYLGVERHGRFCCFIILLFSLASTGSLSLVSSPRSEATAYASCARPDYPSPCIATWMTWPLQNVWQRNRCERSRLLFTQSVVSAGWFTR